MGLDFDIIDDKNELVDRFTLKWLYDYDITFFNNIHNNDIDYFINYCNQEIKILKLKLNNSNKFYFIKYLDFENKKKYLLELIDDTKNDNDMIEVLEQIGDVLNCDKNIKLNIENYQNIIKRFEYFKLFLEKYIGHKYEIS